MKERMFLIGFMGTGKTTVGSRLAKTLNWALYDSDHEIVKREGRSIPEIFETEGEVYFRQVETAVLADLATRERAVITTGGGAVLAAANRECMQTSGHVVHVTATLDEIVRRVAGDTNRPLLQSADSLRARVEQLILDRQGLYDFAELAIETTGKEIDAIVSEILLKLSAHSR
jgi:shikimate kinase